MSHAAQIQTPSQRQSMPLDDDDDDDNYNNISNDDEQTHKDLPLLFLDEKNLDPVSPSQQHTQYLDHYPELRRRFQSPYSWSTRVKLLVLAGPSLVSLLASYSAGAYALASEPLRASWGITDVQFNAGITLYVAGFGFAPMVLAPLSEAYGRYWVFFGSGIAMVLGNLGCALSQNLGAMLVSRFIVGNSAAVYVTVMGGVIGDVHRKEDRNQPMAMYSLSIMIGTGLGPLVSGAVVDTLGWRWIFYLQVILIGAAVLVATVLFRETRTNVLLDQYCRALNQRQTTNQAMQKYHFKVKDSSSPSSPPPPSSSPAPSRFVIHLIIWRAYALPLRLLLTEPVVFWFSMWVAFAWSILYMQFSSVGIVFRSVYAFDSMQVGAVYAAVIVGSVVGAILISLQHLWVHSVFSRRSTHHRQGPTPEERLLPSCLLSVLLPIGIFWFGWTARTSIHWISPTLAIGCLTVGVFSIYVAVFNYLADSYQAYASSAMAAQSMFRNLLSGVFPLVTGMMIQSLSIRGIGSLLGGLGLLLTGIPWLLYFWGRKIRARSEFANQAQGQEDW